MEEIKDLVSFVIPLYNSEKYIKETLISVSNQTYQNFEVLIVDDKSTDNSVSIVKEYIKDDPRFHLYLLDSNGGSAIARNYALDRVKGRYVSFLDSDDMIDPNYLESQLFFIQDHSPIVVSSYRRLTPKSNTIFDVPDVTTYKSCLRGNPLACLCTLYDFILLKEERFPIDMQRHEDYVFWLNILKKGYKAYGNHNVLATYRILNTSKNGNKIKLVKPLFNTYHKYLRFNIFKSLILTFEYCFYSKKKYFNVN